MFQPILVFPYSIIELEHVITNTKLLLNFKTCLTYGDLKNVNIIDFIIDDENYTEITLHMLNESVEVIILKYWDISRAKEFARYTLGDIDWRGTLKEIKYELGSKLTHFSYIGDLDKIKIVLQCSDYTQTFFKVVKTCKEIVNFTSKDGSLPITIATWEKHYDIVDFLLTCDYDPNQLEHTNGGLVTPLMCACRNGSHKYAKKFLRRNRSYKHITMRSTYGTAIHYAILSGDVCTFRLFLNSTLPIGSKERFFEKTNDGFNALTLSIVSKNCKITEAILAHNKSKKYLDCKCNVPLNLFNEIIVFQEMTALDIAKKIDNSKAVDLLKNINPNFQ